MEFLDEDARPRIVFQSRPLPSSFTDSETQQKPLNKPLIFLSISFSSLLLFLSILFVETEPFKSLLIWVSLSFVVGPFAPSHITGGDIRVGQGPILEPLEEEPEISTEKRAPRKRSKPIRSEETVVNPIVSVGTTNGLSIKEKKDEALANSRSKSAENAEEKEWSTEDVEILKKQMVKNPVGKPKRWEVIAEAFKGRHRVEGVIKKSKEMGEKKLDDNDSYAQFLKNRKPMDSKRIESEIGEVKKDDQKCNGGMEWSSAEDIALLNGLKAFPKEVAMRWEKIAAAVPGKTKAACIKRVSDLKKDFRSSKAGAEN
ncbi:transcription factor MAMYB [Euphorbia lathyris]|uniref:transcription factor MAMYB n=1 Tax=Euphorbia lathyris TaxID=212925 RepID=UPI003313F513